MLAFQWNANFVTGLSTVDEQHQHLVDLINRLGALLSTITLTEGVCGWNDHAG
ncbi:hypothetical protein [Ectothiorhodospira sp. BSL-9]|uniref:hypothetical protein n=1 Tax=Ectothiorhodospira sp. BSL-9 TaxID=1442136 RepID=UPI0012E95E97|nr:hypothetical protein [Ectothiorhodospira sp. BSL-9]